MLSGAGGGGGGGRGAAAGAEEGGGLLVAATGTAPTPPAASSSSSDLQGLENNNKITLTSSTLKRNPKMELSRSDLLRLLSVLEGELQAREIVIAVLKAEQVKRLLYPKPKKPTALLPKQLVANSCGTATMIPNNKLGNKSINHSANETSSDAYSALFRDACEAFDPFFDEASTKTIYHIQLRQLDCYIEKQQKTRNYLKSQLQEINLKYNAVFKELEYERLKSEEFDRDRVLKKANDLEVEREGMQKELEAIKSQLDIEREREKKMIICLLAERKQLIVKLIEEKQKNSELAQLLTCEKGKISEMVEGLEEESKRSLQMELDLERLGGEYEAQKDRLKDKLLLSETRNAELAAEVDRLRLEMDLLKGSRLPLQPIPDLGEGVRSTIVTMASTGHRVVPTVSSVAAVNPPKVSVARPVSPNKHMTGHGQGQGLSPSVAVSCSVKPNLVSVSSRATSGPTVSSSYATIQPSSRVASATPVSPLPVSGAPCTSAHPASQKSVVTGKVGQPPVATAFQNMTYNMEPISMLPPSTRTGPPAVISKAAPALQSNNSAQQALPRRPSTGNSVGSPPPPAGRGAPPPVPPNKPVLPPQVLKERSKELQQAGAAARAKLIATSITAPSVASGVTLKPVPVPGAVPVASGAVPVASGAGIDSKQGEKQASNGASNHGDESLTNGTAESSLASNNVDMLCQELADFQQLLVSMVNNKSS